MYRSVQKYQRGGKTITKKVTISSNGKSGYKSVTICNNRKCKTQKRRINMKKPLDFLEIQTIKSGKFIPGLFSDLTK